MSLDHPRPLYDLSGKTVWVAGHRGMVGSALMRRLEQENIATLLQPSRADLDLASQAAVDDWIAQNRPDAIFFAAAKVGGIQANDSYPADFIYDNLIIAANIIHAAHKHSVEKLLFLGSSCVYPKMAPQPIPEDALLTGPLEPTNEWYAIAKIAGIKLCQAYRKQHNRDFISAMPTNLYGPGDSYHLENSHVIPALIMKAHAAKKAGAESLEIWGTGEVYREFLHVDDCADALVFLMKHYSAPAPVNVGCGEDMTIKQLAETVMQAVGLQGTLTHDRSKPDGTPRKQLDMSVLTGMGWAPNITLSDGLKDAYRWYQEHVAAD